MQTIKLENAQISYTLNGVKHVFPLTPNREDTEKQSFIRVAPAEKAPILISRQGVYIPKRENKRKASK